VAVNSSGTTYGGDQTFILPLDANADLSGLSVSAGSVTPVFIPGQLNYTLTVENSVATTTVTAISQNPKAKIQANLGGGTAQTLKSGVPSQALKLGVGTNVISVLVTGTGTGASTEPYTVTVYREPLPAAAVAAQNSPVAGLSNAKLLSFGAPAINDSRTVAFQAQISGNSSGIFLGSGSNPQLIVFTGSAATFQSGSGAVTGTFTALGDPVLNNQNQIAFLGTVKAKSGTSQGLWVTGTNGGLTEVAQTGTTFASIQQFGLTDQGGVAFLANLKTSGKLVTAANSLGLWTVDAAGQPALIARVGYPLSTGTTAITALSIFASPAAVAGQTRSFNANGEFLFSATFADKSQGIFATDTNGVVFPVSRTPDLAPLAASTGTFTGFGSPIINQSGNAAFQATIAGSGITKSSNSGIWMESGPARTLTQVAQLGGTASIASGAATVTGSFTSLSDPVFNAASQVAFIGSVKSSAGTTQGVWITGTAPGAGGSALQLLAQTNLQAPDCAQGVVFSAFTGLVLPDQSGPIVVANLAGTGITGANNQGLWAVDATGELKLVARKGDAIVIDSTTTKTIGALEIFSAQAAAAGQTRSFNSVGDLIYKVTFTDNTQGIYEAMLP
jgi:hypothetical protein